MRDVLFCIIRCGTPIIESYDLDVLRRTIMYYTVRSVYFRVLFCTNNSDLGTPINELYDLDVLRRTIMYYTVRSVYSRVLFCTNRYDFAIPPSSAEIIRRSSHQDTIAEIRFWRVAGSIDETPTQNVRESKNIVREAERYY